MSLMQLAPRALLKQKKLATMTLTRMYGTEKRSSLRQRRPELKKPDPRPPVPCSMALRRSENRCNQPRLKIGKDDETRIAIRRRRLELKKNAPNFSVPCYMALRRSENRCNQPRLKPLIDECMEDPCGMEEIPLDLDHYTPSDKAERKYQRTWCECYVLPKKFVNPKKCYPNRPRRNLRREANAGECVEAKKNLLYEGRAKPERLIEVTRHEWPCCKLVAPGCEPGREVPSCKQYFPPSCCKKRRTQYPSFSECQPVGLLDPILPCECDRTALMCDVYAYWRRLNERGKKGK
ncbi:hypothetical protein KR054_012207 [Drosophila jambulina]|nr:hypothetical protein KR054_012207 [Drosophila jambulina]